jgi:hypothetical protein
VLLGSNLKMKTKREYRKANAKSEVRQVVECRFVDPIAYAFVVRVHNNRKKQHRKTSKHENKSNPHCGNRSGCRYLQLQPVR